MAQRNCTKCGTTVNVKADGNLWRHKTSDEVYCESPTNHVVEAAPLVFEAHNSTKESEVKIDVAGADAPRSDKVTVNRENFLFVVESNEPCIFQGDPKWEASNKKLALKKAKDAGKRPTGEPRFLKHETNGRKRTLFYEVPVE